MAKLTSLFVIVIAFIVSIPCLAVPDRCVDFLDGSARTSPELGDLTLREVGIIQAVLDSVYSNDLEEIPADQGHLVVVGSAASGERRKPKGEAADHYLENNIVGTSISDIDYLLPNSEMVKLLAPFATIIFIGDLIAPAPERHGGLPGVGQSLDILSGKPNRNKPAIMFRALETPRIKLSDNVAPIKLDNRTSWFQPRVVAFVGNKKNISDESLKVSFNEMVQDYFTQMVENAPQPSSESAAIFQKGQSLVQSLEFQIYQSPEGRRMLELNPDTGELTATYVLLDESTQEISQILGSLKVGISGKDHYLKAESKALNQLLTLEWRQKTPPSENPREHFRFATYELDTKGVFEWYNEGSYTMEAGERTIGDHVFFDDNKNTKERTTYVVDNDGKLLELPASDKD